MWSRRGRQRQLEGRVCETDVFRTLRSPAEIVSICRLRSSDPVKRSVGSLRARIVKRRSMLNAFAGLVLHGKTAFALRALSLTDSSALSGATPRLPAR